MLYQTTLFQRRGFTLVEASVVLAILVVLVCLAAPSFSRYIATTRLEGESAKLTADLRLMRTEAVLRNRKVFFRWLTLDDRRTCYVVFTGDSDSDCVCNGTAVPQCANKAEALKVQSFNADDFLLSSNRTNLSFNPQELSNSGSLTISLSNSYAQKIDHAVNITGRVRTCVREGVIPGRKACEAKA